MSTLTQWLAENGFGSITEKISLGGGCINQVSQILTESGEYFCLKENSHAPKDFFRCEANGLHALAATNSVTVPTVAFVDSSSLLLEFIEKGNRQPNYWATLGEQLAKCHTQEQHYFGFSEDNYCGETPQINTLYKNGYDFFAEQRLLIQAQWARDKGLLNSRHIQLLDKLTHQLEHLVPEQAPALLHGDLWSGNIYCDQQGQPVLIDPACYWGWPEADLAMTSLFGGFSEEFYRRYEESRQTSLPMEPGWRERIPIYNLYHLLNHLNLFGSSYLPQIEVILRKYT